MDLFKDMKFQLAVVTVVVAAIHFFMPDIEEAALFEVVGAIVGLILGGHAVADKAKKSQG